MKHFTTIRSLLQALAMAMNLINPDVENHHQRTAYLAYHIGAEMGLETEDLHKVIVAALLHDVVEDCGVPLEDLPVNEETREIVRLLTKPAHPDPDKRKANEAYFGAIAQNPKAALVQCLDRLINLSNRALGFTRDSMAEYVDETEEFVLPLREKYRYYSDDFSDASWIIDYHMKSLLEAFKRIL